jgi:hypothetical protein
MRAAANGSRPRRGSRGLGIVELVVTMAMFVTLMAAIVGILRSSSTMSRMLSRQGDLQERSRRVVEVLARELRWADLGTFLVTVQNGSNRLTLRTPTGFAGGAVVWSTAVTYQIDASNVDSDHDGVLDEGALVRVQDGRTTVLCNGVPAGGFTATLAGSNLQIDLRLQETDADQRVTTTTASAAVTLRNDSA